MISKPVLESKGQTINDMEGLEQRIRDKFLFSWPTCWSIFFYFLANLLVIFFLFPGQPASHFFSSLDMLEEL